eukprot:6463750-Amphidinium_carterae.1
MMNWMLATDDLFCYFVRPHVPIQPQDYITNPTTIMAFVIMICASVTAETTDVLVDVDELEEIDETEVVLEEEDDVLNELTEEDDVLNVVTDVGVEDDEVVVGDDVDVDVVRTVTTLAADIRDWLKCLKLTFGTG